MQKIEEAVALYIEDEIEFARIFVRHEVAAFDAGCMQQHVNAHAVFPYLVDHFGYSVSVREVDAEVVRRSPGSLDRVDRHSGRLCSLQRRQFLLHQRRRGSFAPRLDPRE